MKKFSSPPCTMKCLCSVTRDASRQTFVHSLQSCYIDVYLDSLAKEPKSCSSVSPKISVCQMYVTASNETPFSFPNCKVRVLACRYWSSSQAIRHLSSCRTFQCLYWRSEFFRPFHIGKLIPREGLFASIFRKGFKSYNYHSAVLVNAAIVPHWFEKR